MLLFLTLHSALSCEIFTSYSLCSMCTNYYCCNSKSILTWMLQRLNWVGCIRTYFCLLIYKRLEIYYSQIVSQQKSYIVGKSFGRHLQNFLLKLVMCTKKYYLWTRKRISIFLQRQRAARQGHFLFKQNTVLKDGIS